MMDRSERELFERSLRHATAHASAAEVDAALEELGWLDALALDAPTAIATLFSVQGEANAASSALDDVLAVALGVKADAPVAVLLPALGAWDPPAVAAGATFAAPGLATGALDRRAAAVVVTGGDETVAHLVPRADLRARAVTGLDPDLGLREVTGLDGRPAEGDGQPGNWADALALGQLALGHELVGASRAMLALARDHAVERVQFGRPIAGFQAVRHRLAESLVAVEGADAVLAAAWETPSATNAALAKAAAGRSALLVARHAQQVLAGIGFTTDHRFHRYLRRVLVLDQLLGSSRSLTRRLGEDVIAVRRLSEPLPL
jgi:hypothetical protein